MAKEKDKRTCMDAALAKLNYRMRTEKELRDSLRELKYDDEEIGETVEELRSYGYLDDARYVREFYRVSRRKSWSRNRIIRSLREKGVPNELIMNEIQEFEESPEFSDMGLSTDERGEALKVGKDMLRVQLGYGKAVDDRFINRVGRRLSSLGYDSGTCYYVMNILRNTAGSEDLEEDI